MSRPVLSVAAASISANAADQLLVAAVPLILVAAGASAGQIAAAVAAQAAAWLLVSLPMGVLADRLDRRALLAGGGALVAAAGAAGALAGGFGPAGLGAVALLAGAGVVTIVLASFALVAGLCAPRELPTVNARIELGRAAAMLLAPLAAGELVARGAGPLVLAGVAALGLAALAAALSLPRPAAAPAARTPFHAAIAEGCRFVAAEPLLRAIAACAVAWNAAYFALLASFAAWAAASLAAEPAAIGRAMAANGAGLLAGALVAPAAIRLIPAGALFVFGPASSFVGALLVATTDRVEPFGAAGLGFFLIGFGPMIWLVLQTTVRQLVTPPTHLARVSATLTTAIYGVRPLGALAAGALSAAAGPAGGIALAVALFALSALAMLASPAARRLSALPAPAQ
jgi:MFS family permease